MSLLNNVTLQTPESVSLKFTLAGIGNRAYALLIDYLLWAIALLGALFGWSFLAARLLVFLEPLLSDRALDSVGQWLAASYLLLLFAIYMGYFVAFEVAWQGQTPGKRWVKIRVICEDGRPARLPQALLRSLLRPIDDISFLGLLVILLNGQEKRIGDWLAGTLVIQEAAATKEKDIQIPEAAQMFGQQILETATLDRLTPENFAIIRAYLQRYRELSPSARQAKSSELAHQVRDRLHVSEIPPDTTSLVFLQAVYWAYQQAYGDRL